MEATAAKEKFSWNMGAFHRCAMEWEQAKMLHCLVLGISKHQPMEMQDHITGKAQSKGKEIKYFVAILQRSKIKSLWSLTEEQLIQIHKSKSKARWLYGNTIHLCLSWRRNRCASLPDIILTLLMQDK